MGILVMGEGPTDCQIAFVGEAPGAQEAAAGRPFVGTASAGEIFNACLRSAGIVRDLCYVTNVIKERPTGNDITPYLKFGKSQALGSARYMKFVNYLKEELAEVKANVIVPLGRVAMWTLTQQLGITVRRGSILTGLDGRKHIPTIHPAACIDRKGSKDQEGGQYLNKYFIVKDFERIREECKSPELNLPSRHFVLNPTFHEAMGYINSCRELNEAGIDIECFGEVVTRMGISRTPEDAISIMFARGMDDVYTPEQELQIWQAVTVLLEDQNVLKIGQNVSFDMAYLLRTYGIKTSPIADTMVAQGILYPDFPKGLHFIAAWNTREPYYKDEGKKRMKSAKGSEDAFSIYNAKDCCVCQESFPKIANDLEELGNLEVYNNQVKLVEPCVYMQERGVRVDIEGLKKESEIMGEEIKELELALFSAAGYEFNPKSPTQLRELFYIKRGYKPYRKRDGTITTDEDALKRLARKGSKEAKIMLKLRKKNKMKGTYLDVKTSSDGRIRTNFNPIGSKYGRLASSKDIADEGSNLQNQPQYVRKYFLADIDYMLYSVDLSQAENRIVAYIAPEPSMIKAFEEGRDLHRMTGGLIFNKRPEDISDKPKSSSLGNGEDSERDWGKKGNHSFNYGFGYRSFAMKYEMPEIQAKMIRQAYYTNYPGVTTYQNWVQSNISRDRQLVNCLGRKYLFLKQWGDSLFLDAYAFIPQSTVADIINQHGLIPMYYEEMFKITELLLQVHDEIVFQMHLQHGFLAHAEILLRVKERLEITLNWLGREFVIPADFKMGLNWSKKSMVDIPIELGMSAESLAAIVKEYTEELWYGKEK